jgi:hypothetical protein
VLLAGFLADTPSEVPPAHAAVCQATQGFCLHGYRSAIVDVDHVVPGGTGGTPVEPDDGESWNITAYWNTNNFPCVERTETATVDVSWNGSDWVLSNESTTTNIFDIELCGSGSSCTAEYTHSYGYRLVAKVYDPVVYNQYNLRQVVFTTTSVDDGYEIDTSTCTTGDSVSPTSQSFSATDSPTHECGFSCGNTGTTLNLTYE